MHSETKKRDKICYIMQKRAMGTHMDYVYEMARTLRKEKNLPLTLMIEKGECASEDSDWCTTQKYSFAPLRVCENFFKILFFRFSGHKIFYVHYSFLSAISAGIITKIFGGTVYYWNCGQPWMYKRPFFTDLYQKLAYRLIDYLVTGVEAVVPGYMETYGLKRNQVHIIPNWIDLDSVSQNQEVRRKIREELHIPENAKVLLFVHKLAKRKGAHFLPEILHMLNDNNVFMVIAGDGEERVNIEEGLKSSDVVDRARMFGFVDRNRVSELLQASDIFLMPSEEEGSPHSLIEAMAYGLPFVAFDVGGVCETASPKAAPFISSYGDIDSLVSNIRELLQHNATYSDFQKDEIEWVKHLSKRRIADKFATLLTTHSQHD